MNKRWLRRMDFTLIIAAVAIILMSLVIIGSATHINAASEGGYGFVQRQGARVRDLGYEFASDSFTGTDLTILARHLFEGHSVTLPIIRGNKVRQQDLLPCR